MNVNFCYALYGAIHHYWTKHGSQTADCDLPYSIVDMFGEKALNPESLLPDELDIAVEYLEGSGVPKKVALRCLRHNTGHPNFPEEARTYVRGLLASLELSGNARGEGVLP